MIETTEFTSEFFQTNRKRLRTAFGGKAPIVLTANGLLQKSADANYPFTQDSNFWYLCGLDEPSVVLVMDGEEDYLILPKRDPIHDVFHGELNGERLIAISGVDNTYPYEDGWKKLSKKLKKVKHVATIQPPKSYIEVYNLYTNPAKAHLLRQIKSHNSDATLIDMRPFLASLRSVKQPQELDAILDAVQITERLYKELDKKFISATKEGDLDFSLKLFMLKNAKEFAYETVMASGPHALIMHYIQNNADFSETDFLLVDMAAKSGKYSCDVTRTAVRQPSKRQRQVFDAVSTLLSVAQATISPGKTLQEIEDEVLELMGEKLRELGMIKSITKEALREHFPHLLTHHVGLDVHDGADYKARLVPGMVLAVEPGIYSDKEGIGVRLENTVLVTENGVQNLTGNIALEIDRFA